MAVIFSNCMWLLRGNLRICGTRMSPFPPFTTSLREDTNITKDESLPSPPTHLVLFPRKIDPSLLVAFLSSNDPCMSPYSPLLVAIRRGVDCVKKESPKTAQRGGNIETRKELNFLELSIPRRQSEMDWRRSSKGHLETISKQNGRCRV